MRPEKKALDLTDDEKVIYDLLKIHVPIDLNELKSLSKLTNKKWDKAFKGLTSKRLVNLKKEGDSLIVGMIGQLSNKK